MKKLYSYQQEMVDKAQPSTALFWDMGLGKTLTSLSIYKKFNLDLLVVVCPLPMVDEWIREFEEVVGGKAGYLPNFKLKGNTLEDYIKLNDIKCVVLNYDRIWRIADYSWVTDKTMMIFDESHKLKNPNSKQGKMVETLKDLTQYKILLTGTPQSKGYIDFYNQWKLLGWLGQKFSAFKSRYCLFEMREYSQGSGRKGVKLPELVGYRNTHELERDYMSKCEFLKANRVYDEIIKQHKVHLPVDKAYLFAVKHRVVYKNRRGEVITDMKAINDYITCLPSDVVEHTMLDSMGSYRSGVRQLLNNEHKQKWLAEFLTNYDKRIVIFYNYDSELRSLCDIIEKSKRPYSIYCGHQKSFAEFKANENGIQLCNYGSGSTGINDLVISNLFIAYSPSDSHIHWQQALKRIDRNGQKNTPIYYFLCSGLEKQIYESLEEKKSFDTKAFKNSIELGGK